MLEKLGIYHILFGIFIYIPLFILVGEIPAFMAVSFFYLGRERRDYEVKEKIHIRFWYKGWNVLKWTTVDLFPVTAFYLLITSIIKFLKV